MNKLAAERNAPSSGRSILDVNACVRATNGFGDGARECRDLSLELDPRRLLARKDSNEHRHYGCVNRRLIFSILIALERTKTNPGVAGRRGQYSTNGIGNGLRKVVGKRMLGISNKLDRDDWHAA